MNQGMLFVSFYGVCVLMMEILEVWHFTLACMFGPENLYMTIHNTCYFETVDISC